MASEFAVAKFIPDLARMEPRNFGVILWVDGAVRARFAAAASLGGDADESNYLRWVAHWERLAAAGRIQVRNRRAVTVRSPRFLKELMLTQGGNYALDSGGEVVDAVSNIDDAADFLFQRLVLTTHHGEMEKSETLKQSCDRVLSLIGLAEREDFAPNHDVDVDFGDVTRSIRFDYALASDSAPRALFNRVNIRAEQSVNSAAGKFAWVEDHGKCDREHCISLYDAGEDDEHANAETIKFLNHWSVPVNIASPEGLREISSRLVG